MRYISCACIYLLTLFTAVHVHAEPLGLKLFGLSLGDTHKKAMNYIYERCNDHTEEYDYVVGKECLSEVNDQAELTLWVTFTKSLFKKPRVSRFRAEFETVHNPRTLYNSFVKALKKDNLLQADPEYCGEVQRMVNDPTVTTLTGRIKLVPASKCLTRFYYRLDGKQMFEVQFFDVKGYDNTIEISIWKF